MATDDLTRANGKTHKRKRWGPFLLEGTELKKVTESKDGETKFHRVASWLEIDRILQDVDTKAVEMVLRFWYLGSWHEKSISRSTLTKRKIFDLTEIGADITEANWLGVLEFLNLQERTMQVTRTHSSIGFGKWNDKTIFKLYKAIGCDSTYSGSLKIEPQGTYERWKNLILNEVIGNQYLELALAIGLAAPVSSLIASETGMEVIVFHIYGDSSQGKTTAAMLAVSPFGYPSTAEGGLVRTWNGTQNAVLAHLRDNHGVPMAFDEASMQGGSFSNVVYILANGRDKDRLTKEAVRKPTSQWSGVVLSTAEHSLRHKSKQNTGIQMRLFEVGNAKWTRSAENAERLKEGLLKNYGHAGRVFTEHLMTVGKERIVHDWRRWHSILLAQVAHDDGFASRVCAKMAVILTAVELANNALELGLNIDLIRETLLEIVNDSKDDRDLGTKAADTFAEYFSRYRSNFRVLNDGEKGEVWGRAILNSSGAVREIHILPAVFEEWMHEAGFEDTNVILQAWRNRGWLDCADKRLTKKKAFNGSSTWVHVVRLPSLDVTKEMVEPRPGHRRKIWDGDKKMRLDGLD